MTIRWSKYVKKWCVNFQNGLLDVYHHCRNEEFVMNYFIGLFLTLTLIPYFLFRWKESLNRPSTLLSRPIHYVSCHFPLLPQVSTYHEIDTQIQVSIIIVVGYSNPSYCTRGCGRRILFWSIKEMSLWCHMQEFALIFDLYLSV